MSNPLLRCAASTVVALLTVGVALAQLDENEVLLKVRSIELNLKGAADETGQRLFVTFKRETYEQHIAVSSGVIEKLGPFTYWGSADTCTAHGASLTVKHEWRGAYSLGSQHVMGDEPCDTRHGGYEWLVDRREVIVKKSYQDRTITYVLAVPKQELDDLRAGQKVSFRGTLKGMDGNYLFLDTNHITPETHMMTCANGHEYAPTSGYKFCPLDGTPVK